MYSENVFVIADIHYKLISDHLYKQYQIPDVLCYSKIQFCINFDAIGILNGSFDAIVFE